MNPEHNYTITIEWTGNNGNGTSNYQAYERSHSILVDNKTAIFCSSDPAFRGDPSKHNPEELFIASIASCHMLWFLHLCAEAGIVVTEYSDKATGIMTSGSNGGGRFTEVTLHPKVIVASTSMKEKTNRLHKKASKLCFIANSLNFPVQHQPVCDVKK